MITLLAFWIIVHYKIKGTELVLFLTFILDIIAFVQLGKFA